MLSVKPLKYRKRGLKMWNDTVKEAIAKKHEANCNHLQPQSYEYKENTTR